MRVLIIDTYYPAFLDAHYAEHPELAEDSYEVQWRRLMDRFFGTSDAYSHYLGELGHEAHEFVVNCDPLQRAWAREHGVRHPSRRRLRAPGSLVLAQAEHFRPDVVYVQDVHALHPRLLKELRARADLLVGQIASRMPRDGQLLPFQLLLTSFSHFVPRLRQLGIASEYFRIGFDPRVLTTLETTQPAGRVVFIGSVGQSRTWRSNMLLEHAAERAPIDFWGYRVGKIPTGSALDRRYHGEAWGLDMFRLLATSTIALNRHGDVAEQCANNMRLYEATGVGTLLITDAKANLAELFEPDKEVVGYTDEDDLVNKIHHYLANEEERARIARAGQERTLRDHTYAERMRELQAILDRYAG